MNDARCMTYTKLGLCKLALSWNCKRSRLLVMSMASGLGPHYEQHFQWISAIRPGLAARKPWSDGHTKLGTSSWPDRAETDLFGTPANSQVEFGSSRHACNSDGLQIANYFSVVYFNPS